MRDIEKAFLLGHPVTEDSPRPGIEEERLFAELTSSYPRWTLTRTGRGWEALHRTERPDLRTARIGIRTHLLTASIEELADALAAQRALRGEGAEPQEPRW
ncbi:hypothetical protein [Nocardiopsis algeriensis]|uniref:Uncharacterized protein n=1 Tax=Nocardiopsis algeriensis TaxID=1478215 RepID=A0A841IN66_9ACTN|nr:hypothetical protein [Nocardiopsis algeriensis]MBB6118165.1 hypothetical protein [Nocardiopsis algeriensis]